MRHELPRAGQSWSELEGRMREFGSEDVDWRDGRAAVYVFHAGEDVLDVARQAYALFQSENGLGAAAFPSLARMEREGAIKGYSVVLGDSDALPMVQVIVMLAVTQQDTPKIIQRLEDYPEIKLCLSVNGEFDLMLSVEAPRIEDLDVLVDELGLIPGVNRTKTHVVFGRRIDRD